MTSIPREIVERLEALLPDGATWDTKVFEVVFTERDWDGNSEDSSVLVYAPAGRESALPSVRLDDRAMEVSLKGIRETTFAEIVLDAIEAVKIAGGAK